MSATQELLKDEITRCCDLIGNRPDSDEIQIQLFKAYEAINNKDLYAMIVVMDKLKEFK